MQIICYPHFTKNKCPSLVKDKLFPQIVKFPHPSMGDEGSGALLQHYMPKLQQSAFSRSSFWLSRITDSIILSMLDIITLTDEFDPVILPSDIASLICFLVGSFHCDGQSREPRTWIQMISCIDSIDQEITPSHNSWPLWRMQVNNFSPTQHSQ